MHVSMHVSMDATCILNEIKIFLMSKTKSDLLLRNFKKEINLFEIIYLFKNVVDEVIFPAILRHLIKGSKKKFLLRFG